jgi:hypothetical protein
MKSLRPVVPLAQEQITGISFEVSFGNIQPLELVGIGAAEGGRRPCRALGDGELLPPRPSRLNEATLRVRPQVRDHDQRVVVDDGERRGGLAP